MANVYYDGSLTTGLADGTSWANAYQTINAAITGAGVGGTVWAASSGVQGTATITITGITDSRTNPVRIISVDKTGATPPGSGDYLAGARLTASDSAADINSSGVRIGFEFYGIRFECADQMDVGTNSLSYLRFTNCHFEMTSSSNGRNLSLGGDESQVFVHNCTMSWPNNVNSTIDIVNLNARTVIDGLSFASNNAINRANLIEHDQARGGVLELYNCDFATYVGTLSGVVVAMAGGGTSIRVANIKIPSGEELFGTPTFVGREYEAYNIDNGNTIYKFIKKAYGGTIIEDTANYLDATYDGTGDYSVKFASNANAQDGSAEIRFKIATVWNPTANATVTVHAYGDHATALQDDEFYIVVDYLDATTGARGKSATTRSADYFLAGTNVSTEADPGWTKAGSPTNPRYYAPALTLSGDQKGPLAVFAVLAKPSTTVYVSPKVTLS